MPQKRRSLRAGREVVGRTVSGESIFALDVATGAITVEVGPFAGECDDLLFAPDGDVIATAFIEGAVRRHAKDGGAVDLATCGRRTTAVRSSHRRQVTSIASGLPVGCLTKPYPRSGGVAASVDGVIYIASDVENALYRISRCG